MKRLIASIMALGIVLCFSSVYAESLSVSETLKKIPAMKQGIGYSLKNSNIEYLTTVELMNYKKTVALEAGYTSQDRVILVVSAPLLKLKDVGVSLPILDLIELNVGLFYGYGGINIQDISESESTYGLSLTLLNVKF